MNVLDLFSGIGGFSLGLERAGMRTVAFCEVDPFCRRVLAKHWFGTPCYGDIAEIGDVWEQCLWQDGIEEIDVICGGFPCQDISLAGEGAGLTGERSGLYRELVRAIRLVRPRYAIVENVAALLNRGMGTVLGDLAEIGHDAEWHCIPARAVGAPHLRDRVWIVTNPGSKQYEGDCTTLSGEIAAQLSRAAANANGDGLWQQPECKFGSGNSSVIAADGADGSLANSECGGLEGRPERSAAPSASESAQGGITHGWPWAVEPNVGRVAHGVPNRVDRLRGLGNAVVPQIPEIIGRAIMTAANLKSAIGP